MRIITEEYPCTTPVKWVVEVGSASCDNLIVCYYPESDEAWTQSSDDCIRALYAASRWIDLGHTELEKWQWVRDSAPEWLTVEVIDVSNS